MIPNKKNEVVKNLKKRKVIWIFLVVLSLILGNTVMYHSEVHAVSEPGVTITSSKSTVNVGDTITVSVNFSAGNVQFCYLTFKLAYNNTELEYVSHSVGSSYRGAMVIRGNSNSTTQNDIEWEFSDDVNKIPSGTALTVTFKVKSITPGNGNVVFLSRLASSNDGDPAHPDPISLDLPEFLYLTCAHGGGTHETIDENCEGSNTRAVYCNVCNAYLRSETLPASGHAPGNWTIKTEPTCEGNGLRQRTCTRCHKVLETEILNATGHNFGDWIVVTPATIDSCGEEKRVCANCGKTETRAIDQLDEPTTETPTTETSTTETPTEEPTTEAITTGDSTGETPATEAPATTQATNNSDSTPKTGDIISIIFIVLLLIGSFAGGVMIYTQRRHNI